MALALDASTPVRWSNTVADNTALTSASFTAPAGALLVVCVDLDCNADIVTSAHVTVTDSGGLTWTRKKEQQGGSNHGYSGIFTAVTGASTARTVSVQCSAGRGGAQRISAKCYVWTGQDPTTPLGATGSGASTTNNLSAAAYTSTANNSRGIGCGTDWAELGVPTSTDTADGADYTTAISVVSVYKAADTSTSGSAVTLNFDAAGTAAADWSWVALEILPAAVTFDPSVVPWAVQLPESNQVALIEF